MKSGSVGDLWWKNAVIYCLDVETFHDSDADGVGDFRGLIDRLDYLAGLGVTCLWLMPFYPSEQHDDGYDITDYFAVDPRLGDLGTFTEFVRTAGAYGLKVVIDLVVNHTSNQHPWFQESRSSPDSPRRNYYVWRDEPPEDWETTLFFPGKQETNWTFDEQAGQYYLHHFYSHQPDLNVQEPMVRQEIHEILGFWTQQGIAGFRMDAVPYVVDSRGGVEEQTITPHALLQDLRGFLQRRKGDSILLGETNLPPEEVADYLRSEDELQLAFNFHLNQHVFLAFARQDPQPIREALAHLPSVPDAGQWANFLKNHDELTLDQLSPSEREEVFEAFGPEPDMQLFGRGIRRRVPTMLGGDERRIRLAYSLMFSLPGTPVLFYGEEIGMGENLDVEGRLAVRTPMQWLPAEHGGFSCEPDQQFVRPMPNGERGPQQVNVGDQQQDEGSMLNWMHRLIQRRRETPEIGTGEATEFDTGDPSILALRIAWDDRTVLVLHNFSDHERTADISEALSEAVVERRDIWGDRRYEPEDDASVQLSAYGYRWLRLIQRGQETLL